MGHLEKPPFVILLIHRQKPRLWDRFQQIGGSSRNQYLPHRA